MYGAWWAAAIGGAIGATVRFLVNQSLRPDPGSFPWHTTLVNLAGCFAIGACAAWFETRIPAASGWRVFWMTGVLGGLTTFSAFGLDFFRLLRAGNVGAAWASVALQVFAGLCAVALGWRLFR